MAGMFNQAGDGRSALDRALTQQLRAGVQRIGQELEGLKVPAEFVNLEGGGIEQQYDRRLRFHHCANYAAVLTILGAENRPLRLLELGCGTGALTFAFARTMPAHWTILATDYSQHLIDYARRNYRAPNLKFECLDIKDLNRALLNEIDVVLMLEVIEHLEANQVKALFSRLHQGLKSGSQVIISTLDRSAFRRPFSGYYPHKVEYTYETLNRLLSRREFNPFAEFRVLRLLSRDTVAAAVRAEARGGYFINRIAGMLHRLAESKGGFSYYQRKFLSQFFWIYRKMPRLRVNGGNAGYAQDLYLVADGAAAYNQESFSLIAVLIKR
jgi:SAM-dependent methyltransferase